MQLSIGIASIALCYAGLSGLCLAMQRHQQQVLPWAVSAGRSRAVRSAGWLLLAISLLACLGGAGVGVGFVVWFGLLSAAAIAIVLQLPYAPRSLLRTALAAAPVGVAALIVSALN